MIEVMVSLIMEKDNKILTDEYKKSIESIDDKKDIPNELINQNLVLSIKRSSR